MDFKSIANMAHGATTDIHLSEEAMNTLNELIAKGVFKDKTEFGEFAVKTYAEYKMKGSNPAALGDIVKNSPEGQKAQAAGVGDKLTPLMSEAMQALGKK